MPARKLTTDELKLCTDAIAASGGGRLSPSPADYDVLDTDKYTRIFVRDTPDAQIVAGTHYTTWVVNLAPAKANVVGQFRSQRRSDGGDDTVGPTT